MGMFRLKRDHSVRNSVLLGFGGVFLGAAGMWMAPRVGPLLARGVNKLVARIFKGKRTALPIEHELDRMEGEGGASQPGNTSDHVRAHS